LYAMQYEIPLPADYDMQIIRERVAANGHLLDDFQGLGLKAYLIRERGKDGSAANQYAPFYLWNTTDGMARFLWRGGGFSALVGSFGRPPVQTWTGLGALRGPAFYERPTMATRSFERLVPDADPKSLVEGAEQQIAEGALHPGVCVAACAIDARDWTIIRFTLWAEPAPPGEHVRFEVLHLCRPEIEAVTSA